MLELQTEVALSLNREGKRSEGETWKKKKKRRARGPDVDPERLLRSPGSSWAEDRPPGFVCAAPEVQRVASGGLLSTPSGPSARASLLLFNIHLEKLNLASWKPARRVEFLATSKVLHFPHPGPRCCDFLWFQRLESLVPACLPSNLRRPFTPTPTRPEGGAVAPRAGGGGPAQEHLPGRSPEKSPRQTPGCPGSLRWRWRRQLAVPPEPEGERGMETSWKTPATHS